MANAPSRRSGAGFGDVFSFGSLIRTTSNRSLNDCVVALRDSPRQRVWVGGFNTRFILAKVKADAAEIPFAIEYYRQSSRSSRSSHMVQQLKGILYRKDGKTHLLAKVNFTFAGLMWFWLAVILTLISIGLLLYTQNVVMFALVGMSGSFLLAMIVVLWLDRSRLVRMVQQCMTEPSSTKAQ